MKAAFQVEKERRIYAAETPDRKPATD